MNNIIKAALFCKAAHYQQERKYSKKPYWEHPFRVAANVMYYESEFLNLEAAICAAYLHDVVEDTSHTIEDLFDHGFDLITRQYVLGLTSYSKQINSQDNRQIRKKIDLQYLMLQHADVQKLKLLDRLDNIIELSEDMYTYEDAKNFAPLYYKETLQLLNMLKFKSKIWDELASAIPHLID